MLGQKPFTAKFHSQKNPAFFTENNCKLPNLNSNSNLADMETAAVAEVGKKRSSRKGVPNFVKDNTNNGDNDGSIDAGEHETTHIWTERERRKKMRNMFTILEALLPQLPAKADKSTVVDEAIKYIQSLQQTLQTLENQKLEKVQAASTVDFKPSVSLSLKSLTQKQALESREVLLAVHDQGPNKNFHSELATEMPHSMAAALSPAFHTWFSPNVVLNICGDEAHISVCSMRKPGRLTTIFCILQKHNLDVVSAHISSDQHRCIYMIHVREGRASNCKHALSVEDTFKLAAGEMNLWLLSC